MSSVSFFNSDLLRKERLTQAEKDANDKEWYKEKADFFDRHSFGASGFSGFTGIDPYRRKKVNYDLFNNIIDIKDLEYVCQPFGSEVGELPANFANRDIVSTKIKVLLGMEMKMPFSWKVVAVNEDATTRMEQQEFGMVKDYVINEITRPIHMQVEKQVREQHKGQQLTQEEQQQLQQEIEEQTKALTPDEVRKYMAKEHQDPAEDMMEQILQYLLVEQKIADKFNKGWKHLNLAGEEIYNIGISRGNPFLRVVNNLRFDYDNSPDLDTIQDGEWAVAEYNMSPSEIIALFGDKLTDAQIERIYRFDQNRAGLRDADFTFVENGGNTYTVRVLHVNFKSLQKIGFLTYDDGNGEQLKPVDENYKLDVHAGDIDIDWEWIPESHEVYKILDDIYVNAGPVPGQPIDIENLFNRKLSYYGAACDNLNSPTTSPMDRMRSYQYLYDIVLYRVELLMASDKGKILLANINAIPKSAGIDLNKWMYFLEANKIGFFNPNEEGNRGSDVTNLAKEVDMSLATDIDKYINLAEYINRQCGACIGVTPQMEAQISSNEAVSNTRQNLTQAGHIIQPYFELHNSVKRDTLQGLVDLARVAYAQSKPRKLNYILDDMSRRTVTTDPDTLAGATYGLFVANSSKADEAKQAVVQLSQAALQNQQADLKDIIKVIRSNSITEAEELLEASAQRKQDEAQAANKAKIEQDKQMAARADQLKRDEWAHEGEMIVLKERERRETEIQKQTILSLGFAKDTDVDQNNVPDVLEVAKFGVDADIKRKQLAQTDRKLDLEEDKLDHQKETDKKKLSIETKKLSKPTSSS